MAHSPGSGCEPRELVPSIVPTSTFTECMRRLGAPAPYHAIAGNMMAGRTGLSDRACRLFVSPIPCQTPWRRPLCKATPGPTPTVPRVREVTPGSALTSSLGARATGKTLRSSSTRLPLLSRLIMATEPRRPTAPATSAWHPNSTRNGKQGGVRVSGPLSTPTVANRRTDESRQRPWRGQLYHTTAGPPGRRRCKPATAATIAECHLPSPLPRSSRPRRGPGVEPTAG
jgi:hypothetical protein